MPKKTKTVKHPRKKSAYIKFVTANRPSLVRERPNLKSTEIISVLAKEWNSLSQKDKDSYK